MIAKNNCAQTTWQDQHQVYSDGVVEEFAKLEWRGQFQAHLVNREGVYTEGEFYNDRSPDPDEE